MKPEQHVFSAARDNVYGLSEIVVRDFVYVVNGDAIAGSARVSARVGLQFLSLVSMAITRGTRSGSEARASKGSCWGIEIIKRLRFYENEMIQTRSTRVMPCACRQGIGMLLNQPSLPRRYGGGSPAQSWCRGLCFGDARQLPLCSASSPFMAGIWWICLQMAVHRNCLLYTI